MKGYTVGTDDKRREIMRETNKSSLLRLHSLLLSLQEKPSTDRRVDSIHSTSVAAEVQRRVTREK